MKLLALDTTTEACSAALLLDDGLTERYEIAPQGHAGLILPMVESLLAEAGLAMTGLDALAFGRGPGSFTGVRIGAGVVQGLAFGADLPVVPVSSLAALAQGALREWQAEAVLAAIDARMNEVYWGAYRLHGEQGLLLQGAECVCPPESVPRPEGEGWYGVGSGWSSYGEPLKAHCGSVLERIEGARFPRAQDVARLAEAAYNRGEAVAAEQALPVYLRDNVAKKKAG